MSLRPVKPEPEPEPPATHPLFRPVEYAVECEGGGDPIGPIAAMP